LNKSLNYRKDIRSVEQFVADIDYATRRERILLEHWIKMQKNKGLNVSYEDTGVDNTGKFIEEGTNNFPDFRIHESNNTYLAEVKANEYAHRNTFKVADLKTYIENDAKIFLFYNLGKGCINLGKGSLFAVIEPEAQLRILNEIKPVSSDRTWGYKPVVILREKDFLNYFLSDQI
jgi:hypothetical protein